MKKFSPFKKFSLENFPFIEDTIDALTEYQILCKIVQYLKEHAEDYELHKEQYKNLSNQFTELKSYVDNYFKSFDIQDEVNKGLNILVENGILSDLINNVIFEELNIKIENLFDKIYNDKFSMTFVKSATNDLIGLSVIIQNKEHTGVYDFTNQRSANELLNTLQLLNVNNIDMLFISHVHEDHIAGLNALLNNNLGITFNNCKCIIGGGSINWSKWLGTSGSAYSELYTSITNLLNQKNITVLMPSEENTHYNFGSADIYAFNVSGELFENYYNDKQNETLNDSVGTNLNNFSLCLRIEHNNNVYCLTGDIMPNAQSRIYNNFIGVDVLQIEHHGLNYMSDENYLNAISPKYSVIPAYYTTYESYINNIKLTAQKCINSGILLDTLYSGMVTIYDDYYGINIETDNIIKPYPSKNTNLYAPEDLRSGDFNTIPIGDYTIYNQTNLRNIENNPSGINGGGRLFNIKTTNTTGETQIYLSAYTLHNTIGIRQKYVDNNDEVIWGKWKYFIPSFKTRTYLTTNDFKKSVELHLANDINRIVAHNGFITVSLSFKTKESIESGVDLIEINQILQYNRTSYIILFDDLGNAYPCIITNLYPEEKTVIRPLKTIPTNTDIRGCTTFDLHDSNLIEFT